MKFDEMIEGIKVSPRDSRDGDALTITYKDANIAVAIRTITITNPSEWMAHDGVLRSISGLKRDQCLESAVTFNRYLVTALPHAGHPDRGSYAIGIRTELIHRDEAENWENAVPK